jgi:hypothetical protein
MATEYLVKADLKTHVYAELLNEIDRGDLEIIPAAIAEAVGFVKSYLGRFNRTRLFNPDADGFIDDKTLLAAVKDVAVWKSIRLANPNLTVAVARTNYEDAVGWLKDIQKGLVDPEGWPYKDDDANTDGNENSSVQYTSNKKRNNHL